MTTPIGGRYYPPQSITVSQQFIASLANDGVSPETIRAIQAQAKHNPPPPPEKPAQNPDDR